MKKVGMLLMGLALTFTSCEKEVENPDGSNIESTEDCTCGVIIDSDNYATTGPGPYPGSPGLISVNKKIKVKNDCSGNVSNWIYTGEDGNQYDLGYDYCHHSEW